VDKRPKRDTWKEESNKEAKSLLIKTPNPHLIKKSFKKLPKLKTIPVKSIKSSHPNNL
jgi:hypothetical protein